MFRPFLLKDALQTPSTADSLFKDTSKTPSLLPVVPGYARLVIIGFHKKKGAQNLPYLKIDDAYCTKMVFGQSTRLSLSTRLPLSA